MCTVELTLRVHGSRAPVGSYCHVSHVRVGGVGRDKRLSLRGDGREDAFLLETMTIYASAVGVLIEAGTPNLGQSQLTVTKSKSTSRLRKNDVSGRKS